MNFLNGSNRLLHHSVILVVFYDSLRKVEWVGHHVVMFKERVGGIMCCAQGRVCELQSVISEGRVGGTQFRVQGKVSGPP